MMMLNFDFVLRLLVAGILMTQFLLWGTVFLGWTGNTVPKKQATAPISWYHWEARSS